MILTRKQLHCGEARAFRLQPSWRWRNARGFYSAQVQVGDLSPNGPALSIHLINLVIRCRQQQLLCSRRPQLHIQLQET
jgi:hypothetical protein